MALSNSQYESIMRVYNRTQLQKKHELDARVDEVYEKIPAVREMNDAIAAAAVKSAKELLAGDADAVKRLRGTIADLKEQRQVLMSAYGYPADYLEMQYNCPNCKDTGYKDGIKCHCFRQREIDLPLTETVAFYAVFVPGILTIRTIILHLQIVRRIAVGAHQHLALLFQVCDCPSQTFHRVRIARQKLFRALDRRGGDRVVHLPDRRYFLIDLINPRVQLMFLLKLCPVINTHDRFILRITECHRPLLSSALRLSCSIPSRRNHIRVPPDCGTGWKNGCCLQTPAGASPRLLPSVFYLALTHPGSS